jgi:hypothetical protein
VSQIEHSMKMRKRLISQSLSIISGLYPEQSLWDLNIAHPDQTLILAYPVYNNVIPHTVVHGNPWITLTQLFPPALTLCVVARHSRLRRTQSTLRVLTLFVMNTTFSIDNVRTVRGSTPKILCVWCAQERRASSRGVRTDRISCVTTTTLYNWSRDVTLIVFVKKYEHTLWNMVICSSLKWASVAQVIMDEVNREYTNVTINKE